MTQPSASAAPAYLRFPHLHGELVAFTAEDDVWLASLDGGGRAWRVSAENVPVTHPRISPDGTTVAWTSTRDGAPEVHTAPVDGGPARRLTYWGSARTQVRGWTADGEVLVTTAHGQANLRRSWARSVPLDGGPATTLPYGWVGDVARGEHATVLLSAPMGREAAWWKRYRGGTAGKLWIDREGDGEFTRLHEELDGNLEYPVWTGERIAFLSDHEGTGALYSSLADGSDLRRHTPLGAPPGRAKPRVGEASTPGTRPVTAPGSSTPPPVSSGSWTTWTAPNRAASTSASAASAPTGSPTRSPPPAGSAPRPPTTPRAAARSPYAAPSTGSPTARGPPARSPPLPASAPGCPAPSARTARSGWCG